MSEVTDFAPNFDVGSEALPSGPLPRYECGVCGRSVAVLTRQLYESDPDTVTGRNYIYAELWAHNRPDGRRCHGRVSVPIDGEGESR